MSRVEPTFPDVFPLRFIFQDVRTQGTETMERLTQTELAGWHVWCHKFINGRDPVEVEPAVLLSYAAWHGMMCDHEFDLKPQNSQAFLTSKAASLPVASRLELYKIAGLTELEALPLSLPAVAREARRQVEMRRVREAAGLLVDKPGPEWATRTNVRARYFKVWEYLQKPGNAAKPNLEVSRRTDVNKDMVGKIREETRPPTADEIAEERKHAKK